MWLPREVKLHRAEGNGHIARSSTRGGMSVAGGHCQERRAERTTCHGSCIRTALRALPRQRAFFPPELLAEENPADVIGVAATTALMPFLSVK